MRSLIAAAGALWVVVIVWDAFVTALSAYLLMPLPSWRVGAASHENWRASPWGQSSGLSSDDPYTDH